MSSRYRMWADRKVRADDVRPEAMLFGCRDESGKAEFVVSARLEGCLFEYSRGGSFVLNESEIRDLRRWISRNFEEEVE